MITKNKLRTSHITNKKLKKPGLKLGGSTVRTMTSVVDAELIYNNCEAKKNLP